MPTPPRIAVNKRKARNMSNTCGTNRGEPIGQPGYSMDEHTVLAVIRYYCASFAVPNSQSWIGAISVALSDFGTARGPDTAVAALGVLQAVRRARRSDFLFNPADCAVCSQYITGHERLLISALRSASRGQREAALAHATLLCEGNDAEAVVQALEVLINRITPGRISARSGPEMEQVPSASF